MRNRFMKPLLNQRGASVLILSAIASVLILMGTGAMLLLSQQVSQDGIRSLKGYQGDEQNRNALIYAKKLIDSKCVFENQGAWSVGEACSSAKEWKLSQDSKGNYQIDFSICSSRGTEFLNTKQSEPDADACQIQAVKVTLLEMVDSTRRKVLVSSHVGTYPRTATALIGQSISITPCVPGVISGVMDFESFPAGTVIDDTLNSKLAKDYGVQFQSTDGGQLIVADIVGQGDPEPTVKAWMSVLCPKRPNYNRLCFDSDPSRGGSKILTTSGALSSRDISFRVNYVAPVKELSFHIADVDGGESWNVQVLDANGGTLTGTRISSQGYGGNSGNSALTKYSAVRDSADISSVVISGHKNIKVFGFGFDNFTTGINVCPSK